MNEKKLSDEQIKLLAPEYMALQRLEQERQQVTDRFHRMLCLIEPAIANQDSGITFDPNDWTFKYPEPDITGDGVAAIAAVS
jgi:hypothetical protein